MMEILFFLLMGVVFFQNDQRQRRRDEVAAGSTWALRHFKRVENDSVYERLARLVPKLTPATEDCYVFQENWPSVIE